jgi:hypothetical protein
MKTIIFWILLVDSSITILIAVFGKRWFYEHFQIISRFFPLTIGWAIWYFILVLWIGVVTFNIF